MIKRSVEIFIGIIATLLIMLVLLLVFSRLFFSANFEIERYTEGQKGFEECNNTSVEVLDQAKEIEDNTYIYDEDVSEYNFEYSSECSTLFSESSTDQIRDMTYVAQDVADEVFDETDSGFLSRVYSTNPVYSAIISKPTEYMFLLTDTNKEDIIAVMVNPSATNSGEYDTTYILFEENQDEELEKLNYKYNVLLEK